MLSKCRGVNKQLLSTPKLWEKEDLVGTESINQSIYRPGTGQEINRKGTCIKFASNVYD